MGGIVTVQSREKKNGALPEKTGPASQMGLDSRQMQLIINSWAHVKEFGTEMAGMILFKRFFIVAPDTFRMFEDFRDLQDWESSRQFKHHCKIVMNIIGGAVGLLRDPESLESTLEYLGLKHEGFNITQEHFDLMGVELINTFREALGSKLTPEIERAWLVFYSYLVRVISLGMNRMEVGIANLIESN